MTDTPEHVHEWTGGAWIIRPDMMFGIQWRTQRWKCACGAMEDRSQIAGARAYSWHPVIIKQPQEG